jgi:RNA polymerase sigma-70 factor (ECF subfamily)
MRGGPDEAARAEFERVALPHLDQVHGAAVYLTRSPERAADLVQDTFLRAFRFFHRFEPGTNCRAWLLTILHNTFRNRYRAERRERGQLDVDDPVTAAEASRAVERDDDPESLVLSQLLDQEVAEALRALPEEFRSVIVLVDLQELTYEESAEALGCPIGTVRSRLSRGRRLLAERLRGYARARGRQRSGA